MQAHIAYVDIMYVWFSWGQKVIHSFHLNKQRRVWKQWQAVGHGLVDKNNLSIVFNLAEYT